MRRLVHALNLIACGVVACGVVACGGEGTWTPETWGEDFIEDELPAEVFADGCSARFDSFVVNVAEASLVDGNGDVVAAMSKPEAVELAREPGPKLLPNVAAKTGFYDTARFAIRPGEGDGNAAILAILGGHAMRVAGEVTCGADTVTFDLPFDSDTTYDCAPEELIIERDRETETQLTIHGDHLFYDGLENADADVRGQAWVDADANGDGILSQEEMAATPIATLGYDIGSQGDVADLFGFVEALTGTVGHIDGEGHCATR